MAENDKKLNVIKKNTININEIDKNNMHFKERFGLEVKNNNKLPKILIDFLSYLETIKGKSYNTIEAYKIDLSLLFKYLKVYKDYPIFHLLLLYNHFQSADLPHYCSSNSFNNSLALSRVFNVFSPLFSKVRINFRISIVSPAAGR